jgi:hypothetical protein
VFRIRIFKFLDLPDPNPLLRGTDLESDQNPRTHPAKIVRKLLICTVFCLLYDFLSVNNDVNVSSNSIKKKNK